MDSKGPSLYAQAGPSADMTRSIEEDSLVDGPLISADALHSAIRREFQTVPTHCHAFLLSLLHVLYVVLSVCVAVLCVLKFGQEEVCMSILHNIQGDSVIVFGKTCLWLLVLVFTGCVQHHHSSARSRGYLRFYRRTQGLKQLPLVIHSAGNVLLMTLLAARLPQTVHIYLLLSILGFEVLVAVPCLLYYIDLLAHQSHATAFKGLPYISLFWLAKNLVGSFRYWYFSIFLCSFLLMLLSAGITTSVTAGLLCFVSKHHSVWLGIKVMQFNRERAAPDVSQEELCHTFSITNVPTETGFRGGSTLEEVVEKQADLIEYLKQHNTILSKRLLNLTAQH